MKNEIVVLGSTGSIGTTTLSVIKKQNFHIKLLSTDKNVNLLFKQAIQYKVKDVIIEDKKKYKKYKEVFKKNKINLHLGLINIKNILSNKVNFCVNSISGIDGLKPTLDIIPLTNNILIANKESIICGWHLIQSKLKNNKTNFIPIDSEHFSIWKLINQNNTSDINKIILTASGGPFLKKKLKNIINIKPNNALNHPTWKMGKKISIDSSTMMNKVFEFIEAIKIFNLKKKDIEIVIHPSSFVHAIISYNGGLIKFLAHETSMKIPISNALGIQNYNNRNIIKKNLSNLNNLNFQIPNKHRFPVLKLLKFLPENSSFFETILITLNDELVKKYLNNEINYLSIQKNLLYLIKNRYFSKFYKLKPKNIYDIKKMIKLTNNFLEKKIKNYEK